MGTGQTTHNGLMAAGERDLDLFLGGCSVETTEEQIKAHCTANGFRNVKVDRLQTKANYGAFKITATASARDELLKPELWPQGLFVRKYYAAKVKKSVVPNQLV